MQATSPILRTNDHKPLVTDARAAPFIVLPKWPSSFSQPAPCVQRISRLVAQPSIRPMHSPTQQMMALPTVRVNFLPALNPHPNRYTKIYNLRQSSLHLLPRQGLASALPLWTRGSNPPPCIPEEDEYELDNTADKLPSQPTTNNRTASSTPSDLSPLKLIDSTSPAATTVSPSPTKALSRGIYWPDVPLSSMENGLYEHQLNLLTCDKSNGIGLYKMREIYDQYWFGSGSDLLLMQSSSAENQCFTPDAHAGAYDIDADYPPVVIYSNIHLPVANPHSSHSGVVVDSEIRALRLTNKPPGQGSRKLTKERSETDVDRSSVDRPNPGEAKGAASSRSTTPCQVSSASPTLAQSQLGFVDAPRGNSVIVHHPASPFARVPRAPVANAGATVPGSGNTNISIESQKNNVPVPVSKLAIIPTNMAETNGTRSSTGGSRSASTSGTPGSLSSGSPWKKAGLNSFGVDGSGTGHRVRSNTTDIQPTYEEAWDLKMARQLGIGISRLTPVPKLTVPSAPTLPVTNSSSSDPRLALVACPKPVPVEPGSVGVGTASMRPHDEKPNRSGLKFHENRLFDQRPHACKLKNDSACAQPVSTATEYDYAYNGSWSMGVKLNLSLAMNGASETGDTTVPSGSTACRKTSNPNSAASLSYRATTTGSIVNANSRGASCVNDKNNRVSALVPPHVPAHQNQFHENGQSGGGSSTHGTDSIRIGPQPKRLEQAASGASVPVGPVNELDNGSTDSYDESWEMRHGRVVSELTSARFVDPSALGLIEPTSTGSMHSVGQPLSVLTGTGCTESRQQVAYLANQSHSTSPSAPMSNTQVTPTGAGISPSVKPIATNLELLPLEEQPWFHRSLTRSEAEELLRNQPEGSFLVRNSETCPNDYSLTIKHKTLLHMRISRNAAGQYILGEYSKPYATVPQIIYHHARALVPVLGVESVTLTHPVCTRLP